MTEPSLAEISPHPSADEAPPLPHQRVRDWVWENYQTAYLMGTGLLTLGLGKARGRSWKQTLLTYAGVTAVGALLEPCVNPQNERYGEVFWRGDGSRRRVALTFDDGPHPPYTDGVLEVLAREEVTASFFLIGRQVRKYPDLARRLAAAGHLVGSHTENHQNLLFCGASRSLDEITRGHDTLAAALGQASDWFRPPWGFRSPRTLRQLRQLRLQTALWTYDPRDWQRPSPRTLTARVVDNAAPGAIVLLHDGGGDRSATVKALPEIIARLKGHGYKLVRLDQMRS